MCGEGDHSPELRANPISFSSLDPLPLKHSSCLSLRVVLTREVFENPPLLSGRACAAPWLRQVKNLMIRHRVPTCFVVVLLLRLDGDAPQLRGSTVTICLIFHAPSSIRYKGHFQTKYINFCGLLPSINKICLAFSLRFSH